MFGERFREHQRLRILVLGIGESGLAMARWCARHGCRLLVADTRVAPPNLSKLAVLGIDVPFISGEFGPELLDDGIELVAISPGLSPHSANLAALMSVAHERGIEVWGELEFFAQALRVLANDGYRPKVLAISGTNGKTTTTVLTGLLCEQAGKSVAVAGNISPSMLNKLSDVIDLEKLPDVWVLELSSFQLEMSYTFEPDAAVILNITQDHLDWHGGLDSYATAKARIFGPHSLRILNRGDARVMAFLPPDGANVAYQLFGLDFPQNNGDYGIQRDRGITWIVQAYNCKGTSEQRAIHCCHKSSRLPFDITVKRLFPVNAMRIRGLHNAANAMAALALAQSISLPLEELLHGLREYRGERHRVEWIGSIDGVDYINDSKSTNVDATVAALDGLAQRIVLIAGGDGKSQNFAPLIAPVSRWCRAVMLIGRDAPVLRTALSDVSVKLTLHPSLQAATRAAAAIAQPGDAVLLSPACASLDMFSGYIQRAQVFLSEVKNIAADKGALL
ncbi:UDP-N-acetylmuramoyl-L-alanine--D-glutamate ligase [Candidatus Vallotia cooleyia]|uniref:UDP-N-acetylmuramoyl-L-alanine--D-glutamate ligase n=1 Tax=Candidatus Vallotiella adelgis TaxID=1177211 RepID=UPI001D01C680|nr:UDP-N-acetylmuramoyl-L-alanine--D-glutamate ligase [Candidatus Vallotia cooleyia]UDG82225.1 UDP-N-acetylmuramoylalanine--D-glutamate ligase [Candidatus Vallotia cooleyia]